jgi:glucose/arabinose dehydrogenase
MLGVSAVIAATACTAREQSVVDSAAGSVATADTVKCTGDNAGLTLPAGVCATIFADSVGAARHIAVASNGDVYVTLEGTDPKGEPQPASVIALRDTTRDGRADVTAKIGATGNTGIALANGYLYVDEGARIVRYKRGDEELAPSGPREVVVQNLPLLPGHRARNIAVGGDGALYVNVGSHSNSCQKKDRAAESPGNDPCTELDTRAGIWRFDANKTGQPFSREARYATGIRNGMGMTIRANDGALFVAIHGRDQLHDN